MHVGFIPWLNLLKIAFVSKNVRITGLHPKLTFFPLLLTFLLTRSDFANKLINNIVIFTILYHLIFLRTKLLTNPVPNERKSLAVMVGVEASHAVDNECGSLPRCPWWVWKPPMLSNAGVEASCAVHGRLGSLPSCPRWVCKLHMLSTASMEASHAVHNRRGTLPHCQRWAWKPRMLPRAGIEASHAVHSRHESLPHS
jgi:hypothetical protein